MEAAGIAQLGERRAFNSNVGGSRPPAGVDSFIVSSFFCGTGK